MERGNRNESSFLAVFLFENLDGHIINSSVVKNHDSTIGTRLDVHTDVLTKLIVYASEIVAYGLNCEVKFVGNATSGSVGQTVFKSAEFVECDGFAHTISI